MRLEPVAPGICKETNYDESHEDVRPLCLRWSTCSPLPLMPGTSLTAGRHWPPVRGNSLCGRRLAKEQKGADRSRIGSCAQVLPGVLFGNANPGGQELPL